MAVLIVTTTADTEDASDGKLSLREAIAAANAMHEHVDIVFSAADLVPAGQFSAERIQIDHHFTIAAGADITIDGSLVLPSRFNNMAIGPVAAEDYIFQVEGGASLTLRDITLRGTSRAFEVPADNGGWGTSGSCSKGRAPFSLSLSSTCCASRGAMCVSGRRSVWRPIATS